MDRSTAKLGLQAMFLPHVEAAMSRLWELLERVLFGMAVDEHMVRQAWDEAVAIGTADDDSEQFREMRDLLFAQLRSGVSRQEYEGFTGGISVVIAGNFVSVWLDALFACAQPSGVLDAAAFDDRMLPAGADAYLEGRPGGERLLRTFGAALRDLRQELGPARNVAEEVVVIMADVGVTVINAKREEARNG